MVPVSEEKVCGCRIISERQVGTDEKDKRAVL